HLARFAPTRRCGPRTGVGAVRATPLLSRPTVERDRRGPRVSSPRFVSHAGEAARRGLLRQRGSAGGAGFRDEQRPENRRKDAIEGRIVRYASKVSLLPKVLAAALAIPGIAEAALE